MHRTLSGRAYLMQGREVCFSVHFGGNAVLRLAKSQRSGAELITVRAARLCNVQGHPVAATRVVTPDLSRFQQQSIGRAVKKLYLVSAWARASARFRAPARQPTLAACVPELHEPCANFAPGVGEQDIILLPREAYQRHRYAVRVAPAARRLRALQVTHGEMSAVASNDSCGGLRREGRAAEAQRAWNRLEQ
eukprot:scaffold1397_cov254-Pinguiococcus_pyrenoidosus.AAC.21